MSETGSNSGFALPSNTGGGHTDPLTQLGLPPMTAASPGAGSLNTSGNHNGSIGGPSASEMAALERMPLGTNNDHSPQAMGPASTSSMMNRSGSNASGTGDPRSGAVNPTNPTANAPTATAGGSGMGGGSATGSAGFARQNSGGMGPRRSSSANLVSGGASVSSHKLTAEEYNAALNAKMDQQLRQEVKRLRDENTELHRQADRVRKLEEELKLMKGATVLQHEEKVPIRIRQLETDNLRLRKKCARLEEQLRTIESEDYRRRMLDHHAFFNPEFGHNGAAVAASPAPKGSDGASNNASFASPGGGASSVSPQPGGRGNSPVDRDSMILPPNDNDNDRSKQQQQQPNKVVVIRGMGTCQNCKLEIATRERTFTAEKKQLSATIKNLEEKLAAATNELTAVQNWVAHVVGVHKQYPHLSRQLPVASISSPPPLPGAMAQSPQHPSAQLGQHINPSPGTLLGSSPGPWADQGTPVRHGAYLDAQRPKLGQSGQRY